MCSSKYCPSPAYCSHRWSSNMLSARAGESQWMGLKRDGYIQAPCTFHLPVTFRHVSGRAAKTSRHSWRRFSSCCSWNNALLLFTATAVGHLAACSPSLNGGRFASSQLGWACFCHGAAAKWPWVLSQVLLLLHCLLPCIMARHRPCILPTPENSIGQLSHPCFARAGTKENLWLHSEERGLSFAQQ